MLQCILLGCYRELSFRQTFKSFSFDYLVRNSAVVSCGGVCCSVTDWKWTNIGKEDLWRGAHERGRREGLSRDFVCSNDFRKICGRNNGSRFRCDDDPAPNNGHGRCGCAGRAVGASNHFDAEVPCKNTASRQAGAHGLC